MVCAQQGLTKTLVEEEEEGLKSPQSGVGSRRHGSGGRNQGVPGSHKSFNGSFTWKLQKVFTEVVESHGWIMLGSCRWSHIVGDSAWGSACSWRQAEARACQGWGACSAVHGAG